MLTRRVFSLPQVPEMDDKVAKQYLLDLRKAILAIFQQLNEPSALSVTTKAPVMVNATQATWAGNANDGVFQFGQRGALAYLNAGTNTVLTDNLYFDGTNWRYLSGGSASVYAQNGEGHSFYVAGVGTAGAVATLTQVLSVDSAGNGTFTAAVRSQDYCEVVTNYAANAYYSSGWKYRNTTTPYLFSAEFAGPGTASWLIAAPGTANAAITWVAALTADSSGNLSTRGSLKSSGSSGGVGYAIGAGGVANQATSLTTGVTLNAVTGAISLQGGTIAANSMVAFTFTNSTIAQTDILAVQLVGIDPTIPSLIVTAQPTVSGGSATIRIRNVTSSGVAPVSGQIDMAFAVIKGVTS